MVVETAARKAAGEATARQTVTETVASQEAIRIAAVEAGLGWQTTETSTSRQNNTSQMPSNNRIVLDVIIYANPDRAVITTL
jgi:hypothetical protein